MIKHWTPFEGKPFGTKRHRPRVTLTKTKVMTFNRPAFEALGRPEAVKFFFDEGRKLIGVRAEPPESSCAFPLQRRGEYSYRFARTSAFCGHFGIEPESTVAFNDVTVDDDGMLTLDLRTAVRLRKQGETKDEI